MPVNGRKKRDSREAKQPCQAVVASSANPHLVSSCDENGVCAVIVEGGDRSDRPQADDTSLL